MPSSTKKNLRAGRPRAYERDTVLEQAMQVFWRKGYAATSLDDLVQATGVNRPSLYLGFGNKEALYVSAMRFFRDKVRRELAATLTLGDEKHAVAAALRRFYSGLIDIYAKPHRLGCALFCTAVSEAPESPGIRAELRDAIDVGDAVFERVLTDAKKRGLLSSRLDPRCLARLLSAAQHTLALRARAGASRDELEQVADAAVSLLG